MLAAFAILTHHLDTVSPRQRHPGSPKSSEKEKKI
jgi:hypothetical protein